MRSRYAAGEGRQLPGGADAGFPGPRALSGAPVQLSSTRRPAPLASGTALSTGRQSYPENVGSTAAAALGGVLFSTPRQLKARRTTEPRAARMFLKADARSTGLAFWKAAASVKPVLNPCRASAVEGSAAASRNRAVSGMSLRTSIRIRVQTPWPDESFGLRQADPVWCVYR